MENFPLLCFDIDGTIETQTENSEHINGPVKISTLHTLSQNCEIFLVSSSPYHPKFKSGKLMFLLQNKYELKSERHKNLLDSLSNYVKTHKKFPPLKLYISNDQDWLEAKKAGFVYVDAQMFANGFD